MGTHEFRPHSEEPEIIGDFEVLERIENPDGTVTKKLEDGYVDPKDPDAARIGIQRALAQIAREKKRRRGADGRTLPITVMRQPARPETSAGEIDSI
jgi:hypothetical protein